MDLKFTAHAKEHCSFRNINREEISEVLRNPGQILGGQHGRKIAQSKITSEDGEHLLRVVFEKKDTTIYIITAYRTSKISKYWRENT